MLRIFSYALVFVLGTYVLWGAGVLWSWRFEGTVYQQKARYAEAKVMLADLYMAEMKHRQWTGEFSLCLDQLEHLSHNIDVKNYKVGFVDAVTSKCKRTVFEPSQSISVPPQSAPQSFANKDGFLAVAVGHACDGPTATLDIWTINHEKQLLHFRDGSCPVPVSWTWVIASELILAFGLWRHFLRRRKAASIAKVA